MKHLLVIECLREAGPGITYRHVMANDHSLIYYHGSGVLRLGGKLSLLIVRERTYYAHGKLYYRKGKNDNGEIPVALTDHVCSDSRDRYNCMSARVAAKASRTNRPISGMSAAVMHCISQPQRYS